MNSEFDSITAMRSRQRAAFASVTTLFFAWGFITVTVDPLIATLKALYKLAFAEVMLTQFSFFMAYGLVSLPASALVARLGYPKTIVSALAIMVTGCLCVLIATHFDSFAVVLVALFIIASGITVLQVAANPLAALLGAPERSHYRLTLSQAFNSLGTALAPYLVSSLILAGGIFIAQGGDPVTAAQRSESLRHIDVAFLVIAVALGLLAIFVWSIRARLTQSAVAAPERSPRIIDALRSPWALSGALAIFLYVGAEVSIGSTMTNFLHQNDVLGFTLERAGKLVSLYWGGANDRAFCRQRIAYPPASRPAIGGCSYRCVAAVLVCQPSHRRGCRFCRALNWVFQFHHVPSDLYSDARALESISCSSIRPALYGNCRRRGVAAFDGPSGGCFRPSNGVLRAFGRLRVHQRVWLYRIAYSHDSSAYGTDNLGPLRR